MLPIGGYGASIDLKDAYWHIPIHPHFSKFLGFMIGGKKYKFRALPFGLNIAPRIFNKICRPILRELRMKGIAVLVYIDDWLIWAKPYEECLKAVKIVIHTLEKRGFMINFTKSHLTPCQSLEWLGVTWNMKSGLLSLPLDKVSSLTRDLSSFLRSSTTTRRQIERFLGRLQFAALVDPVGKALLKSLNSTYRAYAKKGLRDKKQLFPNSLKRGLKRWLDPSILRAQIPFKPPLHLWRSAQMLP